MEVYVRQKALEAIGAQGHFFKKKKSIRGGMRKIHMTWQFSKASGPHGHFFEKTKITRFY